MPFRRNPKDDSKPLPEGLKPPAGGKRNRVRGRPGQRSEPKPEGEEKICGICKSGRHLHDFTFRSPWACQCRHPGHGLPKKKRK
jgi:hypothetical protein